MSPKSLRVLLFVAVLAVLAVFLVRTFVYGIVL